MRIDAARRAVYVILIAFIGVGVGACQPGASTAGSADSTADSAADGAAEAGPESAALVDEVDKASYSLGYTMVENIQQNFADSVNEEAFLQGARDRFQGTDRAVSLEDAQAALSSLMAEQQTARAGRAAESLAEGQAYLAENGAREGVVTLDSGLQYEILVAAEGPHPAATDTVTTHYHGTLIDGTVFDSSYERGEPASFPLNGVIPGWTEALQLMAPGAKWRLYIPSELAYGSQDRGPIPANSALIFDVELLEIAGG